MIDAEELISIVTNSQKTLLILCGLPYSGKSYLAKKLIEATECTYVSIDTIFHAHGFDWTTNKLPDSHTWSEIFTDTYNQTKVALLKGENVLYDSTNHTVASRDKLRAVAAEVGAKAVVIFVDTPVDTVWSRWESSKQTSSRHVIDKTLVEQTIASFEKPGEGESVLTVSGF